MAKRGRPMAPWTINFDRLEADRNYSFEEIASLFDQTNLAAEGQIRKLSVKPSFYLKTSIRSRRVFFKGKDITTQFKKKLLLERDWREKDIIKIISKLEKKLAIYFAIQAKSDPQIKVILNEII